MVAYYNEIDPYAAQWLRNLIAGGHIAPGDVDERSIADVIPSELFRYTQCHFFAGIGVWSYALRCAGWPDNLACWTGSPPCQPFSPAGRGEGFADERHLWPAFHHLIRECRPPVFLGEQTDAKAVQPWLDLVHSDTEALDYSFGAVVFPAASVGAPHRRHRTYFVGHAYGYRYRPGTGHNGGPPIGMDHAGGAGLEGFGEHGVDRDEPGRDGAIEDRPASEASVAVGLADAGGERIRDQGRGEDARAAGGAESDGPVGERVRLHAGDGGESAGVMADADLRDAEQSPRAGAGSREADGGRASGEPAGRGAAGGVADDSSHGWREERADGRGRDAGDGSEGLAAGSQSGGNPVVVADAGDGGRAARSGGGQDADLEWRADGNHAGRYGEAGNVADASGGIGSDERRRDGPARQHGGDVDGAGGRGGDVDRTARDLEAPAGNTGAHGLYGHNSGASGPGPLDGFWRAADWLFCRDGKWRPVEPGTFPLAARTAGSMGRGRTLAEALEKLPRRDRGNRVGRLRGYGNAINAEQAVAFIQAVQDALRDE